MFLLSALVLYFTLTSALFCLTSHMALLSSDDFEAFLVDNIAESGKYCTVLFTMGVSGLRMMGTLGSVDFKAILVDNIAENDKYFSFLFTMGVPSHFFELQLSPYVCHSSIYTYKAFFYIVAWCIFCTS